jgi:stress-induced morphogen
MRMADRIEAKLKNAFSPSVLEVIDESRMHNVPKDAETHFKVVVVAQAFDGVSRVDRQRLVYGALADEMKGGVHALSIISKSPAEWEKEAAVPDSPQCLGGSKR